MSRSRRWLAIFSVVSLLLCAVIAAAAIADVRTRLFPRKLPLATTPTRFVGLWFSRSGLEVGWARKRTFMIGESWAFWGFEYAGHAPILWLKHPEPPPGTLLTLTIPLWAVITATLMLPAWFTIATLRARSRVAPGHCPTCGYDVRATPAAGAALLERCPECGNATPSAAERSGKTAA